MNEHERHKVEGAGIRSIEQITTAPLTRRSFMKIGAGAAAAAAALGWAMFPLRELKGTISLDEFLQDHYSGLPLMR